MSLSLFKLHRENSQAGLPCRRILLFSTLITACLLGTLAFSAAVSQAAQVTLPSVQFDFGGAGTPEQIPTVLKIVFLLTILSLAPAILILMTSFTRIIVVFSFLRQALGTQNSPPNQVLVGLALVLTFFIMHPVWQSINQQAIIPYEQHEITNQQFLQRATKPLKDFMLRQTRRKDLALFISLSRQGKPKNAAALSLTTVVPAFVISELKTAFEIGFMLYLPFIILDMVVSSILLSMGMMMLPPVMISLPFKLMLFVLVDGWDLLIGSLVKSFH